MHNCKNNCLNILDLSDEILFIILKKVNTIDALSSLVNVNRRFDRLVVDPFYNHDLNMTNITTIDAVYNPTSPIDAQVLSRISEKILPRIHHHVYQLTVEQYAMKSILHAASYPQLYSLSLINCEVETLYQYLTDDLIFRDLLTKQITHLNIDSQMITTEWSVTVAKIFGLILSLCEKLIVLNYCDMFLTRQCETPVFHLISRSHMSSTLIKLKITVPSFLDCLLLLDGRLECLSTLIIHVTQNFDRVFDIDKSEKLPRLKCFSFTSFRRIWEYDTLIVRLLRRMTNLEELQLFLLVMRLDSTYIDGIQLYDQFLIHMTQLNKFTFSIDTEVDNDNEEVSIELPSNEDVQRSFIGRGYGQVASDVHTTSHDCDGKCHIYSLPYAFDYFVNLDNSFQGGMFGKVRYLKMKDTLSFEYKFFQLISQNFPFLQFLCISNRRQQKVKQHPSTPITFPHLTFLGLKSAHVDYAVQFLLTKNAHLPSLLNICIRYQSLTTITDNFTKDATQFNFTTLKRLDVSQPLNRPANFYQYFPLL